MVDDNWRRTTRGGPARHGCGKSQSRLAVQSWGFIELVINSISRDLAFVSEEHLF